MSRLTWRRQPNETGLRAVCQTERDYELRFDRVTIAHVARHNGGYYFYGCGKNSLGSGEVFVDVDTAKKACKDWVVSSDEFKKIKDN